MDARPLALVTGASAGIGLELCRLLAASDHDLVVVARRRDRLDALAVELTQAHGGQCHVVTADLADPSAPQTIAGALRSKGLSVDLLVNNAGFGSNGLFHTLPLERELAMIQVNVTALVALTGLLLPGMVERGRGGVLNIASTAAFQAGPRMATYYASKAFVLSWSEAIAIELEGTGVRVTAHCPGATSSEFTAVAGTGKTRLFQQQKPATSREVAEHALAATQAGERVAIHGFLNQVGAFSVRFSPRGMAARIAARLNTEG